MRTIFWLLLILCTEGTFAQDDEIPTYHNKWESFLKIKEQDIRSDLATFTLGGLDESIGKQPLAPIPVSNFDEDHIEFSGSDIRVTITAGRFDPAKHKIQYYDKYVVRVDNKPFYGIDGQMPKKTIQSVDVIFATDTLHIPPTAFTDLFEPRFCGPDPGGNKVSCNTRVYVSNDKRRVYIYMLNSSGTGGYEVTWVIQDKQYFRRVIDFGF